jgi:type II secretory pathway component GspD/PulD (secretin)
LQLALLLLLSGLLATSGRADVEVYRAQHRSADDLLSIAEVAMSEGGSVAVDSNSKSLVLVGSKRELAQALELLALQDQRLRSVLIVHETWAQSELEASGIGIRWSVGGDRWRIGNVVAAPGGSGVAVAVADGERRHEATHTATLRVLEGSWGRIASGSELLVPIGSRRNPGTAVVTADSGLEVRPRILGNGRIRLDLRPFQARFAQGSVVNRSGSETTLVVAPGETAVVGGIDVAGEGAHESFLSSAAAGSGQSRQLLLVTATIDGEPPAGR